MLKQTRVTTQEEGKSGPTCEGPYVVMAGGRPKSYCLKDDKGNELPHLWNAEHLKKYFP